MPTQILIGDEEKAMWRENIIDCVNQSSDLIRLQLKEVVRRMIDEDFPGKWTGFPEKLLGCMAQDTPQLLSGSLFVLHQILKKNEFKKLDEPQRVASDTLFREAQPRLLQVAAACLASGTPDAFLVLKMIVKIYVAGTRYTMPMFLTQPDSLRAWLQLFIQILQLEVPKPADDDVEDWPTRPVWKCKKWAGQAVFFMFERYGAEGHAGEEYQDFSKLYTETYSVGVLEVVWKLIKGAMGGTYMPPQHLSWLLRYVESALEPSQTWKVMKPLIPELVETILFPLMCFNDEDAELWEDDPSEYVRAKMFNGWEMGPTQPHMAAAVVLVEMTKKRPKQTLDIVFQFVSKVLLVNKTLGEKADPRLQDGALHMSALIGAFLCFKPRYKGVLEQMLVAFVFPEFASPHKFLRARACHVLHTYATMQFSNPANVVGAIEATLKALQDPELPVRVQASIALNHLVAEQQAACQALAPHIKDIVGVLLKVLHESESDDVPFVLDKLMEVFPDDLAPFALELSQQLIVQFTKLLDFDPSDENSHRPLTASNTMTTLKNVISIVCESPEHMAKQEQVCVPLASHLLQLAANGNDTFLEESFDLLQMFTNTVVSVAAWQGFEALYTCFNIPGNSSTDYWPEMCPFVYNLIRFGMGPSAGVPEKAPAAIFTMCKMMWESDKGEDVQWHAGKMFENFMAWNAGKVDEYVPAIIGLAITRLLKTGEHMIGGKMLRVMCMNLVITSLWYSPELFFRTLESVPPAAGEEPLTLKFLTLWLMKADEFAGLHNRKLGILALCRLLGLPYAQLPAHIQQVWPHLIGQFVSLFARLPIAYRMTAEEEWNEDEEVPSDEGEYDSDGGVEDDDDVDVQDPHSWSEKLADAGAKAAAEDEDDNEELDVGQYGDFETPLDDVDMQPTEYETFHTLLTQLAANDPAAFGVLMSQVTPEQRAELQKIETIAQQKIAVRVTAQVKAGGGYNFDGALTPTTFEFGGAK
jgi:hypothetical protein